MGWGSVAVPISHIQVALCLLLAPRLGPTNINNDNNRSEDKAPTASKAAARKTGSQTGLHLFSLQASTVPSTVPIPVPELASRATRSLLLIGMVITLTGYPVYVRDVRVSE